MAQILHPENINQQAFPKVLLARLVAASDPSPCRYISNNCCHHQCHITTKPALCCMCHSHAGLTVVPAQQWHLCQSHNSITLQVCCVRAEFGWVPAPPHVLTLGLFLGGGCESPPQPGQLYAGNGVCKIIKVHNSPHHNHPPGRQSTQAAQPGGDWKTRVTGSRQQ